ncbi:MAG: hypothetical protein JNK64_20920 [Myxococcales bacterium]|nr:hypothetical protein [Myxococcales bacterium]
MIIDERNAQIASDIRDELRAWIDQWRAVAMLPEPFATDTVVEAMAALVMNRDAAVSSGWLEDASWLFYRAARVTCGGAGPPPLPLPFAPAALFSAAFMPNTAFPPN